MHDLGIEWRENEILTAYQMVLQREEVEGFPVTDRFREAIYSLLGASGGFRGVLCHPVFDPFGTGIDQYSKEDAAAIDRIQADQERETVSILLLRFNPYVLRLSGGDENLSPAQRGRTMGEIRMAKAEMQISLFDYFPNMFEVPSELKTISEKATEESGAGRKAYSYDVGEELVGARKHLASLLKFSPEWYTALGQNPSQAFAAICKDELLGAFPVDECREKGCSSEVHTPSS